MSPEIAAEVNNTPQPFVEGSQFDTTPQLTQAETEKGGIVGPGQEGLAEELERENQEAAQEDAILGKFKSPQELAKAYAELQRKMGEQSGAKPDQQTEAQPDAAPGGTPMYSSETVSQVYGEEAAAACKEKGIELGQVMYEADQGNDISEHYEGLASAFGVTEQVVENYVNRMQEGIAGDGDLSDADAAQIMNEVGGQENFNELRTWVKANLGEAELARYNAVVESGNKEAIRWALNAIQLRQVAKAQDVEPQLYGGGVASDTQVRFESQQQVLDAMNKRNERGQRLYDVDEAYRNKVSMILNNSDVF